MWFLNLKSPAEDEVKAQLGKPSQLSAHAFAFPPHSHKEKVSTTSIFRLRLIKVKHLPLELETL